MRGILLCLVVAVSVVVCACVRAVAMCTEWMFNAFEVTVFRMRVYMLI